MRQVIKSDTAIAVQKVREFQAKVKASGISMEGSSSLCRAIASQQRIVYEKPESCVIPEPLLSPLSVCPIVNQQQVFFNALGLVPNDFSKPSMSQLSPVNQQFINSGLESTDTFKSMSPPYDSAQLYRSKSTSPICQEQVPLSPALADQVQLNEIPIIEQSHCAIVSEQYKPIQISDSTVAYLEEFKEWFTTIGFNQLMAIEQQFRQQEAENSHPKKNLQDHQEIQHQKPLRRSARISKRHGGHEKGKACYCCSRS